MAITQGDIQSEETPKRLVEQGENKDPWKHRSKGMRCSTCMYFVAKQPAQDFGRCRRHAPTMNGYPAVFSSDWCGDHKLDEEKLYA